MGFIEEHAVKNFNSGDVIFKEDDPGKSMFIIQSGIVDILVKSGNKHVVVATLTEGAIFGEMALIDGRPRSATVRAKTNVHCYEISQMLFQKRLAELPGWMQSFYHILVDRLRDSTKKIGSAVTEDTPRQIIVMLNILNQEHSGNGKGDNTLLWKDTVQNISTVLNIPTEPIEKVLNKLTITPMARSEVNYEGRKFVIDDLTQFENFAVFCKNKSLSKLGNEVDDGGSDFTGREQDLLDFITKLVKEQAGAADLEEYHFKNRLKTDKGMLFDEIRPEFDRLVRKGIIVPRRDEDGHKFYDTNLDVIRKLEENAKTVETFEALEEKLIV